MDWEKRLKWGENSLKCAKFSSIPHYSVEFEILGGVMDETYAQYILHFWNICFLCLLWYMYTRYNMTFMTFSRINPSDIILNGIIDVTITELMQKVERWKKDSWEEDMLCIHAIFRVKSFLWNLIKLKVLRVAEESVRSNFF